jgi:Heterokaryon incompatibility protein (HET)
LSYTWRDPHPVLTQQRGLNWDESPENVILCDGPRLAITRNLSDALHQFRQIGILRPLWIDAVCINQADLDERGIQVAVMGAIFSNAEEVLVWLGAEDPTSNEAGALLTQIGDAWLELGLMDFADPSSYRRIT